MQRGAAILASHFIDNGRGDGLIEVALDGREVSTAAKSVEFAGDSSHGEVAVPPVLLRQRKLPLRAQHESLYKEMQDVIV